MRISINSWHYKLADILFLMGPDENLCKYFWKVVIGLGVCWIIIPIGAVRNRFIGDDETVVTISLIGAYLGFVISLVILLASRKLDVALVFFGIILFVFAIPSGGLKLILMSITWYDRRTNYGSLSFWHPERESKKYKKWRGPNIFIEFLRAKKGKYCPRIDFVNDHNDGAREIG
jgi:hypothetical protein